MKPAVVVSSIVILNAAAFAILGCQSNTPFEDIRSDKNRAEKSPDAFASTGAALPPIESSPGSTFGGPVTTPQDFATQPAPGPIHTPEPVRPVAPPPPPPASRGRVYVARDGDSLHRIARREKVSVQALARANGLSENAGIRKGQKLVIPAKSYVKNEKPTADVQQPNTKQPDAGATVTADANGYQIHTVQKGEVLGSIARKYHVSVAKIMELNGITDAKKVREGRKLRIPHPVNAPASAAVAQPAQPEPFQPAAPETPLAPAEDVVGGSPLVPDAGNGATESREPPVLQ